jgi:hypothetical protein
MLKKSLILFFALYVHLSANDFVEKINQNTKEINDALLIMDDPKKGLIMDTSLVLAGITAWGITQWDWGTESFHAHSEGWFEKDSKTGGSDKTGHLYMTYLLSRMIASRAEDRGYTREEASLWGAISGLAAMTLLEVGDSTSPYGFSKEDWLADAIGAGLAYWIRANPRVDDFLDVRVEYWPKNSTEGRNDFTTDYSNMKHLIAFQLSGFEEIRDTPLRFIELQAGYYSRGYRSYDTMPESQHLYVGIGFSLSALARESKVNVLENLFEFYQPGSTYVKTDIWSRH